MPDFIIPFSLCLFYHFLTYQTATAWGSIDLTEGFESVSLNQSNFMIQRPYDVPKQERYSFCGEVHKLWVFPNDKPHSPTSQTKPRTEIRVHGNDYSSGVWQFEGHDYVPRGTSGVCFMQVFGAAIPHPTTFMLKVYNGSLYYYCETLLVENIYSRWFKLNVRHDVDEAKVQVYIDGELKLEAPGRGGTSHYFKCGVYAQDDDSYYMESRWKGIKVPLVIHIKDQVFGW